MSEMKHPNGHIFNIRSSDGDIACGFMFSVSHRNSIDPRFKCCPRRCGDRRDKTNNCTFSSWLISAILCSKSLGSSHWIV